ncbi:MAG: transporter [Clostridiales bacterium]|nr:MAG: transporter [Clostridiales bacterium]
MDYVLLKAGSFVLVILLGYALKRFHFFGEGDYKVMTKIAINVTLPAAVITSFASFQRDDSLFILVLLGLGLNFVMILFGFLASLGKNKRLRSFFMMCCPGYNIGSFTLPFVQNFFGAFGVVATCMFDVGNSLMCTGGTYTIASAAVGGGSEKMGPKQILKRLFTSVPFDTYLLMLLLTLVQIKIPEPVVTLSSTIAAANGFCAMMMIGMMMKIEFKKSYLKAVGTTLLIRYLCAGALSAFFYFCSPFSLQIRQVLAIVVFAPVSALAPAFTEKLKGDHGLASFAGSVSIIISIAIMTVLMIVMHI